MSQANIEKLIVQQLIKSNPTDQRELNYLVKKLASSYKIPSPKRIKLLSAYHKLTKSGNGNLVLKKLLKKRQIRTLSGVAVIAVLTKPYKCPGECVFCPNEKAMPKSYIYNEPAVMRAILCKFDPFKQVQMRLKALAMTGHETDKCELIVMGGTWTYLPHKYQDWYLKRCFDAFNQKVAKNLAQAQKWNETAKYRVIGLTLETRPDYISIPEIKRMRELGATRVEIGVQAIDDKILKLNKRGHLTKEIILATKLLKDAGFKISYHMMPNLPGSNQAKDFKMFNQLFHDQNYQPDMLKIYPCVVTKTAKIYRWYKSGKFKPYTDKQLINLLISIKKIVPPYVRLSRIIRDIPSESIVAGNKISNLRQLIAEKFQKDKKICQCIRCREARTKSFKLQDLRFKIRKYKASDGLEYFLSYESKDKKTLFAFLRLRIPSKVCQNLIQALPELKDAALIREVHTYGELIPIKSMTKAVQHIGLGRKLIAQAEKIAEKAGYKKIAVISGIGVRQYYKKLSYQQAGTYMLKKFLLK